MKNYWLVKSEPDVYSIGSLEKDQKTHWDGVRNYQARNNMMKMQNGDLVFFYHSNANPKGIIGIAKVVKEAYPDFTALNKKSKYYDPKASSENPIWQMVDIQFVEKFRKIVTLDMIKKTKALKDMILLKNSRLSVQPIAKKEFEIILQIRKNYEL